MKNRFVVLWRRGVGVRCQYRTTDTGRSLGAVLSEMRPLLEENGIEIEIRVEETADDRSEVFFNEIPLEDLVDEVAGAAAYCTGPSRMEELGHPEIAYASGAHAGCVVPEIIFRKAILLALEE
ncbi:DUF2703 domain-containing protein [Methanofollis aquaemaris]|uniref:DUF2703 domain-containing protein n=1 Tax=Methanofollis aquaemaris TaxID=126734 RepID=A0A8A3S677_9EURY|nr:DUF2703 domain-containing protein [Methanofollis aquaemaris]QSZ67369.1 DUF2703 domain-containing protein [Methanofollis aquaemaris]